MEKQESRPIGRAVEPGPRQEGIRLKLIQIVDGDLAFEAKLREMIWHSYGEADRPFGPTEEGMFMWLEHQQLLDS